MEYRNFGKSGLRVPVLSLGTATFGGTTEFFQKWGELGVKEAGRLVDISLDNGINFFDTANVYSLGESETILGKVVKNRRKDVLIATKATFAMGDGVNQKGASRYHLVSACEDSLRRLQTDYIDILFIHGFDKRTPLDETMATLNRLVESGKVRYIGCSNFAAWQLMKALSISEKRNFESFVIYQGYYSLIGRDIEQELIPLLQDQGLGLMVWSPLGWGRLTGKIKRDGSLKDGRVKSGGLTGAPPVDDEYLYDVLDVLETISAETGYSISQIAIRWLTSRPVVCNIVLGARTDAQLLENIQAVNINLTPEHTRWLNEASNQQVLYPHWVGER